MGERAELPGSERTAPPGRRSAVEVDLVVGGRQLTEPRLGPGGRWLAYVMTDADGSRLALVDLDAASPSPRAFATDPAPRAGRGLGGGAFEWLPDGTGLVYIGSDGGLWRVGIEGTDAHRLWPRPAEAGPAEIESVEIEPVEIEPVEIEPAEIEPVPSIAEAPAVSADGTRVAFMVDQRHIVVTRLDGPSNPVVLTADGGPDFSFDPVFSPDGGCVAFQGWSVPDMAWDGAARYTAPVDGSGPLASWRPGVDTAVQQPGFAPDGTPIAITDATGWLNVWLDGRPLVGPGEPFEHAGPTWGPRQRTWCISPDGARIAFCRNEAGFGRLSVADVSTGTVIDVGRGVHGQLSWQGDRLAAIRSGARTPTEIVVYDVGGRDAARRRIDVGPDPAWSSATLVEPVPVSIGRDPALHARRYRAPSPTGRLLVWVHGGPTSQWDVAFLPGVAFWTSRGWDVLLVDPRGSTGHGRSYQQALRGGWGRLDVDDTAAMVRHAHDAGWGEPRRTVVMGGSSGGLAVLAMLGHHGDLVAGGVALYPVSDIADLSVRSHRFELHYNHTLVGPDDTDEQRAVYAARSPSHYAARITAPLLLLHGTADPVIPVDQSIELAARIRQAGGRVELHLLEGEGHGFRQHESRRVEYRLVESFLDRIVPTV